MDIVYTCFRRREPAESVVAGEVAEVLGALWAHASPDYYLEHASGRLEADRIDLGLVFRSYVPGPPDAPTVFDRAHALLVRAHASSPPLRRRYLLPDAVAAADRSET